MIERFRGYWADTIGNIEKISSRQTFTDILNLPCDLDLEHSNPFFPQDTPAYDAVLTNQVWLQTEQQFRRYNRHSHLLIISDLAVALTLNTVNQFFCMALWLIMPHNHTRFGHKCSVVQKISSKQTFTNILNLRCDRDLQCSNPIFPMDTLAYDGVLSKHVWLQTGQHFRRFRKNSYILII